MEVLDTSMGKVQYSDYSGGVAGADSLFYGTVGGSGGVENVATLNIDYGKISSASYLQEKSEKGKEKKMAITGRGLYQVILVDPKEGKVIFNSYVICSKVEDVLLEAGAGEVIKEKGLKISEVDKIVNLMGQIRRTKKTKDGVVEIIEESEKG